jgi:hypothetical protein
MSVFFILPWQVFVNCLKWSERLGLLVNISRVELVVVALFDGSIVYSCAYLVTIWKLYLMEF